MFRVSIISYYYKLINVELLISTYYNFKEIYRKYRVIQLSKYVPGPSETSCEKGKTSSKFYWADKEQ